MLSPALVVAEDAPGISAEFFTKELNEREQTLYIKGALDGLAYARYVRDGRTTDGMYCIYDWSEDAANFALMFSAMKARPQVPASVIIGFAVERACP